MLVLVAIVTIGAAQFGSGSFALNGHDAGTATIIAFDLMPIDRLTMPSFKILAQCAGVGINVSLMSTGDITVSPPDGQGTLTDHAMSFWGC